MSTTHATSPTLAQRLIPKPLRAAYWNLRLAFAYHRFRTRVRTGRFHEPAVCAAIKRHLRSGGTGIDVGANVGYLTAFMAYRVGPAGRVHAFEPHPDNVEILKANLVRHRLTDCVTVHSTAVTDGKDGTVTLFAGRRRAAAEWNIRGHDVNGQTTAAQMQIPAVALDAAISPGQRIDLMKIDVEGAESLVLAGMQRILCEQTPVLIIECHSEDNWLACTALTDMGYRLCDLRGKALPLDTPQLSHLIALPAG